MGSSGISFHDYLIIAYISYVSCWHTECSLLTTEFNFKKDLIKELKEREDSWEEYG